MRYFLTLSCAISTCAFADSIPDKGLPACQAITSIHYTFGGHYGERLDNNVSGWILTTPDANPGILEMFRMRDRQPVPQLVPWAGEFAGKYLLSAVMALRASDDPALRPHVENFVRDLIATQSPEGYLGPFPKERRLLGEWDLWGHYHCILALLSWHEYSQDTAALDAAKRAGDFICSVYLNTVRRPIQAASDEMNLAIIHGLARLYRITGEQRYLDLVRVVEEDWQKGGDYLRQGLADVPFYKTPRPRWESLHNLQGLTELYRITGKEEYKTALINLWRSIRDHDRHNTGGFTTGEQAIGEPYSPGAIETCCTVAWSALCQDVLSLTGDATVADELELSLYNSTFGLQHPSGRWCTYNTPMDGKREASAHTIVFQARAGTPELNCCSVNGPRGLAMTTEWGIMQSADGAVNINYLGAMDATLKVNGEEWHIVNKSNYPADGVLNLNIRVAGKGERLARIHIPAWSKTTSAHLNGKALEHVQPGSYLDIPLHLGRTERIDIVLDMKPHFWIGDGAQLGRTSIYIGPLLLAFDQRDNTMDCAEMGELDYTALKLEPAEITGVFPPMTAYRVKNTDGKEIILRDFATAGATGTEYRSWLPMRNTPPPGFLLEHPANKASVPVQGAVFQWGGSPRPEGGTYTVELSETADFASVQQSPTSTVPMLHWPLSLENGRTYNWRVRARNAAGETLNTNPPRSIIAEATLPPIGPEALSLLTHREDGLICGDALDAAPAPEYGVFDLQRGASPAKDRNGLAGKAIHIAKGGLLRYKTAGFPSRDYSVSIWVRPERLLDHLAQIFSAWCRGGDDPLRIVIDKGKLFARIEGMGGASTSGVEIKTGEWSHIAAVKKADSLTLYVNGEEVARSTAPGAIVSAAKDIALGGNPHHSADESYIGALDDFALYAHALTPEQIKELAGR